MALKGSCLRGALGFEVTSPIRDVGSGDCSKCRKVSGTNRSPQFIVRADTDWDRDAADAASFAEAAK